MNGLLGLVALGLAGAGIGALLVGFDARTEQVALNDIRDPIEYHRASYAAYFDVDVQTAEAQIALSPLAAKLEQSLAAEYPGAFSGLWIQHVPDFRVVVAMTDSGPGADSVRAIAANEIEPLVEYRTYELTVAELRALASTVQIPDTRFNVEVDLTSNTVIVYVLAEDAETARQELENVDGIGVVEVPTLGGADANVYGGTHLTGNMCTAGFSVKKNGSSTTGLTTAGHCGDTAGFNGQNSPRQVEAFGGNTDAQWHTTPNYTDQPWIRWNPQGDAFDVDGWVGYTGTSVGDWLCKYGRTTGTKCGEVESKAYDPSWVPGAGAVFVVLRNCTADMGESGDSGGPVWAGAFAYGMHSGSMWGGIGCWADKAVYNSLSSFQSPLGVTILQAP